ncbi:MAG TPA: DUF4157 domain-containing protein [Thermosynechococcaceae cyanobacterium]
MQTRSSRHPRSSEPSDRLVAHIQPRLWRDSPAHESQATQPHLPFHDFSHVDLFAHDPVPRAYPRPAIQPKLTVGRPNDQYEQEADRVAEQVIGMPDSAAHPAIQRQEAEDEELQAKPLAATITPLVQRDAAPEEEELQAKPIQRDAVPEDEELQTKLIQREAAPEDEEIVQAKQSSPSPTSTLESQLNSSKGGGSPLPTEVRSFMEPRFGADFSQVRVHTGSEAVQMNRDLNAQAFTHGQDVFFGDGKAPAKDALTAHELTHVVQQNGNHESPETQLKIQRFYLEDDGGKRSWIQGDPDHNYVLTDQYEYWLCMAYPVYRMHRPTRSESDIDQPPKGLTNRSKKDRSKKESQAKPKEPKVSGQPKESAQKVPGQPEGVSAKQWTELCNQIVRGNAASSTGKGKRITIFKQFKQKLPNLTLDYLEEQWQKANQANENELAKSNEEALKTNTKYANQVQYNPPPQQTTHTHHQHHQTGEDVGRQAIERWMNEINAGTPNRGMHPSHTARRPDGRVRNGPEVRLEQGIGNHLYTEFQQGFDGQTWQHNNQYTWAVHTGNGANHADWYVTLGHGPVGQRISDTIIHIRHTT